MKHLKKCLTITATLITLMVTTNLHAEDLRISVAASMTEVFKELISNFSEQHPDITLLPNFGPSGGLAKQIYQGAPADVYVSANPTWMAFLVENNKIDVSSEKTFAYNSLVFLGQQDKSIRTLADLPKLKCIGIGSPKSVPAGQYAHQALSKSGLYDQLLAAGKLVMAKDVRQALIYADRGETNGSFVYKTDALLATRAVILFDVPQDLYSKVTYPLALTVTGANKPGAKSFYSFVTSDEAKNIVSKHGFSIPE